MKRILVTGCAGFIGSHVCELLLAKGYSVVGVDNFDPFYPKELKEKNLASFIKHPSFKFYQLDLVDGMQTITETDFVCIIHLAAKAGVRPSIADPLSYITNNIIGTQNVHEFMKARGIKKLVFASSSSVYGNDKQIPFVESAEVNNPISPYAFTKKAGELLNYSFHHIDKVDIINLRFFTVYGPRQRPDLAINKFLSLIINDKPLVLFGDGSTARDYTYIEDTVSGINSALEYCLKTDNLFVTLNLGNRTPIKLIDLVSTLYRLLNKEKNITFDTMQPGDVDITFADINKAQALIGYEPGIDLETGLKRYIAWLRSDANA